MGVIVKVFCESCNAAWDCHTGCGMQHGALENVTSLFPKDTERILKDYAARNEWPMFDFAFQLAVCKNCAGIVSVPALKLFESDTSYVGVCPDCGKEVKLIKSPSRISCPICKKSMLKSFETGRWD